LLHLGEIVEVAIPSVEQKAARDLVRAREDVRAGPVQQFTADALVQSGHVDPAGIRRKH